MVCYSILLMASLDQYVEESRQGDDSNISILEGNKMFF